MNKEQIIDEVYKNFEKHCIPGTGRKMSKEDFINICKTDSEFSEKWGLKIEERELSLEERLDWMRNNKSKVVLPMREPNVEFSMDEWFRPYGVPTKLITITYKDTILESYE